MFKGFSFIVLVSTTSLAVPAIAAPCVQTIDERTEHLMQQANDESSDTRLSRVIVKVSGTHSTTADDAVSEEQLTELNKIKLIGLMQNNGAVMIEPIADQPLIVMEVTPQGMQNLLGSSLVETVQEDKPEMPQ